MANAWITSMTSDVMPVSLRPWQCVTRDIIVTSYSDFYRCPRVTTTIANLSRHPAVDPRFLPPFLDWGGAKMLRACTATRRENRVSANSIV